MKASRQKSLLVMFALLSAAGLVLLVISIWNSSPVISRSDPVNTETSNSPTARQPHGNQIRRSQTSNASTVDEHASRRSSSKPRREETINDGSETGGDTGESGGNSAARPNEDQTRQLPFLPPEHPLWLEFPGWIPESELSSREEKSEISEGDWIYGDFVNDDVRQNFPGELMDRRDGTFDRANPDGALQVTVGVARFDAWPSFDQKDMGYQPRFEATLIRTRDSASWKVSKKNEGSTTLNFLVPVSDGDKFQLQVLGEDGARAIAYLPVPGTLGNMADSEGRNLFRAGRVNLCVLMIEPDQTPRARTVLVRGANGVPIKGAVILQFGQELGRSDASGTIVWAVPPAGKDTKKRPYGGVFVHAPGFAPLFLQRDQVEDESAGPLEVSFASRELLVSVRSSIDDRFLALTGLDKEQLGSSRNWSEILMLGWDLLSLADDAEVFGWFDVFYYLTYSHRDKAWWLERRANFANETNPVHPERKRVSKLPFYTGTEPQSSWADGLEQAIGRPYHELWPRFYGGWYNGRWTYKDGRFDVVLPYPGKFLLLVGEEYRDNMPNTKPGRLNRVLYIDATDPLNPKGALYGCPD